jgi:hypothetical protein
MDQPFKRKQIEVHAANGPAAKAKAKDELEELGFIIDERTKPLLDYIPGR